MKTSIAEEILVFEVSLAKHFIRPGQVLMYVALVRTRTHLTRMGYTGTSESKFFEESQARFLVYTRLTPEPETPDVR